METRDTAEIFLQDFQVVLPSYQAEQTLLNKWTGECHQQAEETQHFTGAKASGSSHLKRLFQRYGVSENQISSRHFECPDVFATSMSERKIYRLTSETPNGADIKTRTEFFAQKANTIFEGLYKASTSLPDHLVHVTCTGYTSPSAAQKVVARAGWQKTTSVTHAYHMGCYAALPAIRMAQAFVRAEISFHKNYCVDVVHTEMCGLHMHPLMHSPEQMIVQSLFADGHIRYRLSAEAPAKSTRSFLVKKTLEKLVPDSEKDMTWMPSPSGMQMTLAREVPQKIRSELRPFVLKLLQDNGLSLEVFKNAVFAVHPGGPRIIDAVQEELELSEDQVRFSRKILFERGNMSSATLPHIWNEILDSSPPTGTLVVSLAFGPGLTLFGGVFEVR